MSFAHESVLSREALAQLAPSPGGLYCDGTVGGGGHAEQILLASAPTGRLIGIDRDPAALAAARARLAPFDDRVTLVHDSFGNVAQVLERLGVAAVDGFLLDIGVSSHQLDNAERGFSFNKDGPLDMRMDPTRGETALELIRALTKDELAAILRDFGEERFSKRIAALIKDKARAGELHTTGELAALVSGAIPARVQRTERIHPATRTFQALRIAVNRELDELAQFLAAFPALLAAEGRCVIITFHSLEDRLVKRCFRELEHTSSLPPDLARAAGERVDPICRRLTRKPLVADADETARNPRARSAKLRACQKVSA